MGAQYPHVIAFRVDDEDLILAQAIRETFPSNSWGEMFRWMFEDTKLRAELLQRLTAQ